MKLVNLTEILLLSVLVFMGKCSSQDSPDEYDGYYEDGYEEGVEVSSSGSVEEAAPKPATFHGFHRHVGGSVVKISKPLMTDTYLNNTVQMYDCVKRVHANILALEPVPEEEDEYLDSFEQVQELRRQMDSLTQMITNNNATAEAQQNATTNSTVSKTKKEKKISFREKQEQRLREKREKEAAKELLRPKFRLGADCESLVCGSCKIIVEEFGHAVHAVVNSSAHQHIQDVMEGFCKSKGVALKHVDMVEDICFNFEQEKLGYKEALMEAYEDIPDNNWNEVASWKNINNNKQKVCLAIGACEKEQFVFQTKPLTTIQEHWDDKCLVCQAFAFDLEVTVQLSRSVTEGNIVPIVKDTCNRLNLEPYYHDVCKPLTEGKLLDDISWLAKVHGESIDRKAKGELKFPDKLCEEVDWCVPWVDPVKLREKEAQMSMEQVFF